VKAIESACRHYVHHRAWEILSVREILTANGAVLHAYAAAETCLAHPDGPCQLVPLDWSDVDGEAESRKHHAQPAKVAQLSQSGGIEGVLETAN
jgi:hypothetical protein